MIGRISFIPALFFSILIIDGHAQDISADVKMGAEYAAEIEATMGVYENTKMTKYIADVGDRLVAQLDSALFDFQFKIVPTTVPNAFALPGGYLYVTTGLIPLLETEDELACIMAHEIIHANNRHAVKSMKKQILPSILQIPGNILGIFSQAAGAAFNAPIRAISSVGIASYSRKQETEADTQGIVLAAKAGYNPNALKDILSRLAQQVEITSGQAEQKSFLSDHPYTPDRVKSINTNLGSITIKEVKPLSKNFLKEFDGIIAGDDPAYGVVVEQQFIQPTANFSITTPEEWKLTFQGNVVAGSEKEGNADLYCKFDTSSLSPDDVAADFLENISPKSQKLIVGSQAISVNSKPAYMISFAQKHNDKDVYGFRIWMKIDSLMFQVYAIGYTAFREALEEIVYSIKPLTEIDKKTVTVDRLKVIEAQEGETLASLSKLKNNTLSLPLSAIINDHKEDTPFSKGEEVKIIINSPYYE